MLRVEAQQEINALVLRFSEEVLRIPRSYKVRWPNEWSFDTRIVCLDESRRLDPFYHVGHSVEYRNYLGPGLLLKDIADIQLPGKFKRMYVGPEGIPYLSGVDVYQIKVEPRLWLSRMQPELRDLLVSEVGTILVQADGQRYGLLGRPVYVDTSIIGAAISNHLVRIRVHDPNIRGYVYLFLSTDAGRRALIRQSYGSSVPTIPLTAFAGLCVSGADTPTAKQMGQQAINALTKRTKANALEDQAQALLVEALEEA